MSSIDINLRANKVSVEEGQFSVLLKNGSTITVPFSWFDRLSEASPSQRAHYRLIGGGQGIHWPDIDEDLSVDGLLAEVKRRSLTACLAPSSQVASFTFSQPLEGAGTVLPHKTARTLRHAIPENSQRGICAPPINGSQSCRPAV
jgi:hypothetical protein